MELVIVMVIAGVLAITVIPRLTSNAAMDQRGLIDQAKAGLRYAQKTAIAQRRWVKVTDAANGFSLTWCNGDASNGCTVNTTSCASTVNSPATGQAYSVAAPTGVSLSHSGSNPFYFDCEGRPVDASGTSVASRTYTVSATGLANTTFTVETETGYIYP